MSKTIGQFRGKNIEDMDKSELLEVIEWLASEMQQYKKSDEEARAALNDSLLREHKIVIDANPTRQIYYDPSSETTDGLLGNNSSNGKEFRL